MCFPKFLSGHLALRLTLLTHPSLPPYHSHVPRVMLSHPHVIVQSRPRVRVSCYHSLIRTRARPLLRTVREWRRRAGRCGINRLPTPPIPPPYPPIPPPYPRLTQAYLYYNREAKWS